MTVMCKYIIRQWAELVWLPWMDDRIASWFMLHSSSQGFWHSFYWWMIILYGKTLNISNIVFVNWYKKFLFLFLNWKKAFLEKCLALKLPVLPLKIPTFAQIQKSLCIAMHCSKQYIWLIWGLSLTLTIQLATPSLTNTLAKSDKKLGGCSRPLLRFSPELHPDNLRWRPD